MKSRKNERSGGIHKSQSRWVEFWSISLLFKLTCLGYGSQVIDSESLESSDTIFSDKHPDWTADISDNSLAFHGWVKFNCRFLLTFFPTFVGISSTFQRQIRRTLLLWWDRLVAQGKHQTHLLSFESWANIEKLGS